jgi:hypothetical protein
LQFISSTRFPDRDSYPRRNAEPVDVICAARCPSSACHRALLPVLIRFNLEHCSHTSQEQHKNCSRRLIQELSIAFALASRYMMRSTKTFPLRRPKPEIRSAGLGLREAVLDSRDLTLALLKLWELQTWVARSYEREVLKVGRDAPVSGEPCVQVGAYITLYGLPGFSHYSQRGRQA